MHIVVGVGRIPADTAAIRFAAREASSRGRVVRVVHAFAGPADAGYGPARRLASRMVDEAVAIAQRSTPGAGARGQLVDGPPGRVLPALSRQAELLVVGGLRPDLVTRSQCPVAVARVQSTPSGPVTAAVDASPWAVPVLRFAAAAAARREVALHVLHVTGPGRETGGARLLDEVLAQVPEAAGARRRVVAGIPASALITASRRAGLLVLGPRSTAPAGRLGSVATEVVRFGACPAVLVSGARIPARRVARQLPGSPVTH
ncbi:universal stress protein [Actinoplanes sp. G11-F43]|uniref:universal stress protein n=1 Tax=Actinoplanes sp. G11-F43 TaxID=3424130 RepID=UPI003D34B53F